MISSKRFYSHSENRIKCFLCHEKLSVKNIVRPCKKDETHICCRNCFQEHMNVSDSNVHCFECHSFILHKEDIHLKISPLYLPL